MERGKEFFGFVAAILALACFFMFVGYKAGERNAPAIHFEFLPCDG
jgi:hypothetical protein